MNDIPTRTGDTVLDDAELLLCDFIFQRWVPRKFLRQEAYPFHMNCRYSHDLNDNQLEHVLDSLHHRGLISVQSADSAEDPRYTLTEHGGALWEQERRPNWNLYLDDWENWNSTAHTSIAVSESRAIRFLVVQFNSGLSIRNGEIRFRAIHGYRLLPWRTFPLLYVARVAVRMPENELAGDWVSTSGVEIGGGLSTSLTLSTVTSDNRNGLETRQAWRDSSLRRQAGSGTACLDLQPHRVRDQLLARLL